MPGSPLPVYVYPPPWPYDPTATNPYLTHAVNWLNRRGSGASAWAVSAPEVFLFIDPAPHHFDSRNTARELLTLLKRNPPP